MLKKKIRKLEEALSDSYKNEEVRKNEYYEVQLQREISKRKQIESQFAKEADEIQAKVDILEQNMKIKTIAEETLTKLMKESQEFITLDKDCKRTIRQAYGERIISLISIYENKIVKLVEDTKKSSRKLEKILEMVLPSEDKSRTLRFINDNDFESAACILKNNRNNANLRVPRASDLPQSPKPKELPRKAYSKSITPVRTHSSLSKPASIPERKPINEFLIFLQCQASVIEDILK